MFTCLFFLFSFPLPFFLKISRNFYHQAPNGELLRLFGLIVPENEFIGAQIKGIELYSDDPFIDLKEAWLETSGIKM